MFIVFTNCTRTHVCARLWSIIRFLQIIQVTLDMLLSALIAYPQFNHSHTLVSMFCRFEYPTHKSHYHRDKLRVDNKSQSAKPLLCLKYCDLLWRYSISLFKVIVAVLLSDHCELEVVKYAPPVALLIHNWSLWKTHVVHNEGHGKLNLTNIIYAYVVLLAGILQNVLRPKTDITNCAFIRLDRQLPQVNECFDSWLIVMVNFPPLLQAWAASFGSQRNTADNGFLWGAEILRIEFETLRHGAFTCVYIYLYMWAKILRIMWYRNWVEGEK